MPKTISENDRTLTEAVSQMRLATKVELQEYLGWGEKKVEKHITRAKEFGLIVAKDRGPNIPDLLSCDPKYFGRLSPLTFDHELLISLTHAILHRNFTVDGWQQGTEIRTKHVWPDSLFPLAKGELAMDFCLEVDKYRLGKSDNKEQMLKKWRGYIALFQERVERFGPFRVLTVTTSEVRAKNLARQAQEVVSKSAREGYLFTTIDRLQGDPRGSICFVPYEDNRQYPILP
jgi:hypothetical protein